MSSMHKIIVKNSTKMNRELEYEWDSVNTDIWVSALMLKALIFQYRPFKINR